MKEKLTKKDVEKIQQEIDHRKLVVRPEAIEAVKEARAQGDLSENFEYYAAKRDKKPEREPHQIPGKNAEDRGDRGRPHRFRPGWSEQNRHRLHRRGRRVRDLQDRHQHPGQFHEEPDQHRIPPGESPPPPSGGRPCHNPRQRRLQLRRGDPGDQGHGG